MASHWLVHATEVDGKKEVQRIEFWNDGDPEREVYEVGDEVQSFEELPVLNLPALVSGTVARLYSPFTSTSCVCVRFGDSTTSRVWGFRMGQLANLTQALKKAKVSK